MAMPPPACEGGGQPAGPWRGRPPGLLRAARMFIGVQGASAVALRTVPLPYIPAGMFEAKEACLCSAS